MCRSRLDGTYKLIARAALISLSLINAEIHGGEHRGWEARVVEHSLIQQCIKADLPELPGRLSIIRLHQRRTLLYEDGAWCGRDVVFDGERLDRDHGDQHCKRGRSAKYSCGWRLRSTTVAQVGVG